MNAIKTSAFLVALFMVGSWSATAPLLLAENPEISRSGTADRVVINDPPASISADEVYAFEGIIYDAVTTSRAISRGRPAMEACPMTVCSTRGLLD